MPTFFITEPHRITANMCVPRGHTHTFFSCTRSLFWHVEGAQRSSLGQSVLHAFQCVPVTILVKLAAVLPCKPLSSPPGRGRGAGPARALHGLKLCKDGSWFKLVCLRSRNSQKNYLFGFSLRITIFNIFWVFGWFFGGQVEGWTPNPKTRIRSCRLQWLVCFY